MATSSFHRYLVKEITVSALIPIPSPGVPLYFGEIGDPAVLVVHDWYGRLPWLEAYAEAIASEGYRVIVPDLYDGIATLDSVEAADLMGNLDVGPILDSFDDLVRVARSQGSERIGTIGFSLGGWLSLLHSQSGTVDATVAYYSTLGPAQHGVIPSPVTLHFAEVDEWEKNEDPASFVERLEDHGTPVTAFDYPGTVHSFANASILERVDVDAAALAFARTASFLEEHLKE